MVDYTPDRSELVSMLKEDFGWDNVEGEGLRAECSRQGVSLPDEIGDMDPNYVLRSRLRQVKRLSLLPIDQLRSACALRYFNTEGRSREEIMEFLKTFKTLPKPPQAPITESAEPADGGKAACSKASAKKQTGPKSQSQRDAETARQVYEQRASFSGNFSQSVRQRASSKAGAKCNDESWESFHAHPNIPADLEDHVKRILENIQASLPSFHPISTSGRMSTLTYIFIRMAL